MGLLDTMQAQPQSGLLGGGMQQPQGTTQFGQSQAGMPPEMINIIETIKASPEDQKVQMVKLIVDSIWSQDKPDQDKKIAIEQFLGALK